MAAIILPQHYELNFFKESTITQYLSKTLSTVTTDHFLTPCSWDRWNTKHRRNPSARETTL